MAVGMGGSNQFDTRADRKVSLCSPDYFLFRVSMSWLFSVLYALQMFEFYFFMEVAPFQTYHNSMLKLHHLGAQYARR